MVGSTLDRKSNCTLMAIMCHGKVKNNLLLLNQFRSIVSCYVSRNRWIVVVENYTGCIWSPQYPIIGLQSMMPRYDMNMAGTWILHKKWSIVYDLQDTLPIMKYPCILDYNHRSRVSGGNPKILHRDSMSLCILRGPNTSKLIVILQLEYSRIKY